MIQIVPDVERTRRERRKLSLNLIQNVGLGMLGIACYRLYVVGAQEWLPIIYTGVGSSMLTGALCVKFCLAADLADPPDE
ncbi:hypothetical protein H5395_15510 [Paracoccus sp. MC1854]|uniref:hypothetical protein n=1 Tax=Paracoccus sp. MC1854 TaxID=2760306 RepID=UPI00160355C4|nr:hypothetical protein [Paracoccus sp. MC1854]MBB1492901.1 hypothetical protein [Paracoccus sp. MC1854]